MTLYHKITEWDSIEWCCDERKAVCPYCSMTLCVFCEDYCSGCNRKVF